MKSIPLNHPKDQITEIIKRIYLAGLTTTFGGNISIKDNDGNIWVTPSAMDKSSLDGKDIICVKQNGEIVGLHKPSVEFPFHKAIYDARPDIKSVITHSFLITIEFCQPQHRWHRPLLGRLLT